MELEAEISANEPPSCWSNLLQMGVGYEIFHTSARMSFCAWRYQHSPLFVMFRRRWDREPVGLAGIDQYTPDVPFVGRWLRYWRMDSLPVLLPAHDNAEARLAVMDALERSARNHGALILRASSRGGMFGWHEVVSCRRVTQSHEFILKPGAEPDLRSQLSGGRRKDLNKAVRNAVRVTRIDTGSELCSADYRQLAFLERDTQGRSRSIGRSQDYVGWDAHVYDSLSQTLLPAGEAHLFMARLQDDDLVGVVVVLRSTTDAYALHGAYSHCGYAKGVPTLLLWELLLFAHREGIQTVNLGAVPIGADSPESPDHGLHRYKESLGAKAVPWIDFEHETAPLRLGLVRSIRPRAYR